MSSKEQEFKEKDLWNTSISKGRWDIKEKSDSKKFAPKASMTRTQSSLGRTNKS